MNINTNNYKVFTILIFTLFAISLFSMYLITSILENYKIEIPFYFETPSTLSIYGLFFWIFDKYLWKFPIFKKLGIIIADDLNGKWIGIINSSYDEFKSNIPIELEIEQSATNIKIHGKFNESRSVSIHENFGKSEIDNQIVLFYFYRNEPKYSAKSTMAIHEGSVKLIYNEKENILEGSYYSGRDRNNYGTIKVRRVKDNTILAK